MISVTNPVRHVETEHGTLNNNSAAVVESTGDAGSFNSSSQYESSDAKVRPQIRMQKLSAEILGLTCEGPSVEELKATISYKARLKSDGHKMHGGTCQPKCRCPFHDDSDPSFVISKSDDFAFCFGCDWRGDIVQYERDFHEVDFKTALTRLHEWRETGANGTGRVAAPTIDAGPFVFSDEQRRKVAKASAALEQDEALIERVAAHKGWSADTVRRLASERDLGWWDGFLGFHYSTGVKLRNWPAKVPYWKWGANGLWRDRLLDQSQTIYLTEGESDAISLLDCGIEAEPHVAVLAVPGASAFKQVWADQFTGKSVITCFDNDVAGKTGVERVHRLLAPVAASLCNHALKGGV